MEADESLVSDLEGVAPIASPELSLLSDSTDTFSISNNSEILEAMNNFDACRQSLSSQLSDMDETITGNGLSEEYSDSTAYDNYPRTDFRTFRPHAAGDSSPTVQTTPKKMPKLNSTEENGDSSILESSATKDLNNRLDDSISDTETESTVSGEDRKSLGDEDSSPLLPEGHVIPPYLQSESSDTDSVSTPTDSPSKGRLQSLQIVSPSDKIKSSKFFFIVSPLMCLSQP